MERAKNPGELNTGFDEVAFEAKFDELFKTWKSKWAKVGMSTTGPYRYNERAKPFLSSELIEANRPEMEAYDSLLNFCVMEMMAALPRREHRRVFDAIISLFRSTGGGEKIRSDFYEDLMKKFLDAFAERSQL